MRELNHNHFTHTCHPGECNKCTSRKKKSRLSASYKKVLYGSPKSARNILTNLSPNPARPEKPGQTCNSAKQCGLPIMLMIIQSCV